MTDHDQNEAALTLAGMISTTRPFAELHPSAAVPIAAQIVDAIKAGKVSGVAMWRDLPCYAELKKVEGERDAAKAELAAYKAISATEHVVALTDRCNALMAERDAALARVKEAEGERNRLRERHAFYQSIQNSQQSHQSLCARVADAAIRAGVVYNFGACGGGEPSFGAIVSKIEDAIANYSKLKADNERLRGLLREALPFVSPVSHQGPTADELREEYPEACAIVDGLRGRIDRELGQ